LQPGLQAAPVVRFGAFELDLRAGELRKHGLKIKLQDQPFQILVMLLEQPGVVVTREQLQQRLWTEGTFVDFEHGLNAAIQRVRQALSDPADNPRFVATIPRKGYRFIAPVEGCAAVPATVAARVSRRWLIWETVLGAMVAASAGLWFLRTKRSHGPTLVAIPLTRYPGAEISPSLSPDGNYVAFAWWDEKKAQTGFEIFVKLIGGGDDAVRLTHDPADSFSPAWSPDGRFIAFLRASSEVTSGVLLIPPIGGPERKLAEIYLDLSRSVFFGNLSWFPDGKWLAVGDKETPNGPSAVFRISVETGEKQRLTTPPQHSKGDTHPAVSPDGRALVFVRSGDLFLLELSKSLSPLGEPRRLTTDTGVEATAWTPDRRAIVFSAGARHAPSLWRLPLSPPSWRLGEPERLAFAGAGARNPSISRQGRLVYDQYFADVDIWRLELIGSRPAEKSPVRLISSTRVDHEPRYSPDGKRIAFGSDRSGNMEIWVADSDGSNAIRLTSFGGSFYCGGPRWSPDGRLVAFFAKIGDKNSTIYVTSADGGKPQGLSVDLSNWSRDGKWIYFGSTRSGERQLWKMPWPPAGRERDVVQVTKKGFGGDPAIESLDGKFVYYLNGIGEGIYDGTNSLWKVSVEGGDEIEVLGSVLNNNFTIVHQGIYFIPASWPPSVQFMNFANGRVVTIAKLMHEPAWGLSVSPDGLWLLYSEFEERQSDLMLVENFR
jgi:Tol biopolymer transport system component/DNA-binding winged helix-turn-helix (wHTH) protein